VLPLRQRLRCMLTAAEVLRGQAEALNVDRRDMYTALYGSLLQAPLAPLLQDGAEGGPGGGDGEEDADLLALLAGEAPESPPLFSLLALTADGMLCSGRQADTARLAAFVKRLVASAAATSGADAMGLLAVAYRLLKRCARCLFTPARRCARRARRRRRRRRRSLLPSLPPPWPAPLFRCRPPHTHTHHTHARTRTRTRARRYPRLLGLLEWEGEAPVGGRTYDPACADPSEAGALAATLWELPLLASGHFHPHVAAAAATLLSLAPGSGGGGEPPAGPLTSGAATPAELAAAYDSGAGAFRPPPARPPKARGHSTRKMQAAADRLGEAFGALVRGAGGAGAEVGADEEAAAAADLSRVFRSHRQHRRNGVLRQQRTLMHERLRRFREHLHARAAAAREEAAAAAAAAAAQKQQQKKPAPPQKKPAPPQKQQAVPQKQQQQEAPPRKKRAV